MRKVWIVAAVLIGSPAHAGWLGDMLGTTEWTGFYYPNKADLTVNTTSSPLRSLDECRQWVEGERVRMSIPAGTDDYECGSNCQPPDGDMPRLCDETVH